MIWRHFYIFFILYALIDGFISNALFPLPLPLLFKDFILILVFLLFIRGEKMKLVFDNILYYLRGHLMVFALLFMLIALAQIFNPLSPNLYLGILGFKLYFFYWLMIPMTFAYVNTYENMIKLLKIIVAASVLVNIFGLYQFYAGPDFLISRFGLGFHRAFHAAALEEGFQGKSFFRIIGTFSSNGIYANFLDANVFITFALLLSAQTPKQRLFYIIAQALNFFALAGAGSRGAMLFVAAGMVVLFRLMRHRSAVKFIALTAVGVAISIGSLGSSVQSRFATLGEKGMVQERTFGFTQTIFMHFLNENPMGRGLGSASTAARHLEGPVRGKRKENWVENFPAKLQLETGAMGVLTFFAFVAVLLQRWVFEWLPKIHPAYLDICVPLTAYSVTYIGLMSLFGILDTLPGYIFIWMFLGLIFRCAYETDRFNAAQRASAASP